MWWIFEWFSEQPGWLAICGGILLMAVTLGMWFGSDIVWLWGYVVGAGLVLIGLATTGGNPK